MNYLYTFIYYEQGRFIPKNYSYSSSHLLSEKEIAWELNNLKSRKGAECSYLASCVELGEGRKKVQRFGKKGRKLKKPIVTPAKWVCYYYKIPVTLLKMMNKRVVQHSRHWTLEDVY